MVLLPYLNPIGALLKLVRVPFITIWIPLGGSGMPSNSEKILNLVRVPPYGFDKIPHSGSSQVSKFPSCQKKYYLKNPLPLWGLKHLVALVALLKLLRLPLSTILIPIGGSGMPSNSEKIQNLVRALMVSTAYLNPLGDLLKLVRPFQIFEFP